jgi:hypothetical protein
MMVGGHMKKPKFTTRYTALIKKAAAIEKYDEKSPSIRRDILDALTSGLTPALPRPCREN